MKLFIVLFALAAYAMAEAGPRLEARVGCSQKGQFCNDGTFLCCPGQGSCSGGVVSLQLLFLETDMAQYDQMTKMNHSANEPQYTY